MKNKLFICVFISIFGIISCSFQNKQADQTNLIKKKDSLNLLENERIVLIKTTYGNIKIKLYNETPKHRDNFIKLANEKFFDSLLFHRVINNFMIQGGDPDSKNATQGKMLGNGGPGYNIPAEFNRNLIHKKGVIAAAREGDQVNPSKSSSGSQFYIVQGKTFSDQELNDLENRITEGNKNSIFMSLISKKENKKTKQKMDSLNKTGNFPELQKEIQQFEKLNEVEFNKTKPYKFTPEEKNIYKTIGGTPHLDGGYTVFGEVIEGIEIIDKIALEPTDKNNRPLNNIKMAITVIK